MARTLIIGLASRTGPGSGKTYTAKKIRELAYKYAQEVYILSFASPVKRLARAFALRRWGIHIDCDKGKEERLPDGTTVRDLLVLLGCSHRDIDPDFWVQEMEKQISRLEGGFSATRSSTKRVIIIDDVRFYNEYEWIRRSMRGVVYSVELPFTEPKVDAGDLFQEGKYPLGLSPARTIFNDPDKGLWLTSEIEKRVEPLLKEVF